MEVEGQVRQQPAGVNFTNILRASFLPIFFWQKKMPAHNISGAKVPITLYYEKDTHKMLANFIPDGGDESSQVTDVASSNPVLIP